MKKNHAGELIFSPTDLIGFGASPFASWMDRHYLEYGGVDSPDADTEDQKLIVRTANAHERAVLDDLKSSASSIVEIPDSGHIGIEEARAQSIAAIGAGVPIIHGAALEHDRFAGIADFLLRTASGGYQVWDAKLARSPKPYYAIQLCCYSEMLAAMTDSPMAATFGIILGNQERLEFRVEDFVHYYRHLKARFLAMQDGFTGRMADRPEPLPLADHGRWTTHAEKFFQETDHLVRVAGITAGQIKKLANAGITTMAGLAAADGIAVRKLAEGTLQRLIAQARLQCRTLDGRATDSEAPPCYDVLPHVGIHGEAVGLATLPPDHPADVFFDMEGYPLIPGGLEYLFGACTRGDKPGSFPFLDWWAHDRAGERLAFEGFVDWVHDRWRNNPGMHIYHYAAYEVSAVRRLSTRHDTRQDEVDDLLRNDVFVDLYDVVRHGLCIGEDSYSIKRVERLYRPKRATDVANAVDSIVQYANWMGSGESRDWKASGILTNIRTYNEDDCRSTGELLAWLRGVAVANGIALRDDGEVQTAPDLKELPPEVLVRLATAESLREQGDEVAATLADLIDFHRREEKPIWWNLFDRLKMTDDALRDDADCIAEVEGVGDPFPDKKSLARSYRFDPEQECRLNPRGETTVIFRHRADTTPLETMALSALDMTTGSLNLKIGRAGLDGKFGGVFPQRGSLVAHEMVSAKVIQTALAEVAAAHLSGTLPASATALLNRVPPATDMGRSGESVADAAIRIIGSMDGGCLVIQGPPGTGKTYTASRVIAALLAAGKRVGVASNGHKAVVNLLAACGEAARERGGSLTGVKVGGDADDQLFAANPGMQYIKESGKAYEAFADGVIGGTAWLFTRPEWIGALDVLFIDEAGQVSLANAVAMSRCANNLVLLGDQMQLEQPVQGSHPGDAGLSVLQYALKDLSASRPDAPVFHAVVPPDHGLFLGQSRRMHPSVCRFISESIYEGRLTSHPDCERQRIAIPRSAAGLVTRESGILFSGAEHDGNVQRSDEEVERAWMIARELIGRPYTDKNGASRPLGLADFLFIAPYNAQVRALQATLPDGARVGSVDKFQGQEAPVCILSLCCSFGEYGPRGLAFILDRNRINVAVSRAQCLAVVVADPRIAGATAGTLEEMRLLNLFCKLAGSAAVP
jgi:uncharacterized protein